MTLKEKFKERLYNQSHDDSECLRIKFENIDKVIDSQEKIADEFAIGFAEWAIAKNMGVSKFTLYEGELEIYKKEKGL
jgi:hypothetical protein